MSQPADSISDREDALRAAARKHIEIALRTQAEDKQRLRHRTPYWFREYSEYPNGSSQLEIKTQQTESRSAPMLGSVTFDKIRYSTRMHRERKAAVDDGNFLRDTGEETQSYELRNGRWVLLGSTFVAEKSEENINGEWVALNDQMQRVVAEEEQPGWFGRTWNSITGR